MLKTDCIAALLPADHEKIYIAYSGGVDSHVLLHLIALNPALKQKITAVYVHHGLQDEADEWAEHCRTICLGLGVSYRVVNVSIDISSGKSLEELAREARYHALKPLLSQNDVVLLAQHREDQLETVLLQLFRGAGIQGLSGMPANISFGKGVMCRPLLDVSKQDITDYAVNNQLSWIEDPSNKSDDFDRNFLRNQIIPELKTKWPALDVTVARSARHCASAHLQLNDLAISLYEQIVDESDQTLNIQQLKGLTSDKQSLVLRQWFKVNQLRMPAEKIVLSIINEVVNAAESKNPEIKGKDYSIRRYRNRLFCLKAINLDKPLSEQSWPVNTNKIQLSDNSMLCITDSKQGIPKRLWEKAEVLVKFRQGAEKIKLPGRDGRHTLKKLYQEKGIPPWQRSMIPLVYIDKQLAAVANLWISADYFSINKEPCYRIDSNIKIFTYS